MKRLLLLIGAGAIMLQGCGQEKTTQPDSTSSTNTATSTAATPGDSGNAKLPESQRLFMKSAEALKNGDQKGCDSLLEQAGAAALKEGDVVDYLHCKETQAKLRVQQNDNAGAVKILEENIAKYEGRMEPQVKARLDGFRYLLGHLYDQMGQKEKSTKIFDSFENGLSAVANDAKSKKDIDKYLQVKEAQARLKVDRKDIAGATKIIDAELKEYGNSPSPEVQQRIDLMKFFKASLFAKEGKTADAEKIYKATIASARSQKPLSHKRLALALHAYSEFLKFSKKDSESAATEKEALAELGRAK